MRYLAESFIVGALRRGRSVEQFLGPIGSSERRGVTYVEVRPTKAAYEVYVHAVEDVGHEAFWDLEEFPPFDVESEEETFGHLLAQAEGPQAALVTAEAATRALRTRWVNEGVVQDEYRDFVRAGRPAVTAPDGQPWPSIR
ncbi:hypothetical protein [Actinacidiphila glaucinigra]|uniref:Uncharacterized protein n=1 Tax=Actinacidiphila glaucinigra TaxID=235986 RepID=A0A239CL10_9ACTN|nr:hypothetical protein [Actinacidiphila glaucinigra]SNS20855.1 hypothetical protein SAMN05216252_10493 [Actinacidiphila glaucinigra]